MSIITSEGKLRIGFKVSVSIKDSDFPSVRMFLFLEFCKSRICFESFENTLSTT